MDFDVMVSLVSFECVDYDYFDQFLLLSEDDNDHDTSIPATRRTLRKKTPAESSPSLLRRSQTAPASPADDFNGSDGLEIGPGGRGNGEGIDIDILPRLPTPPQERSERDVTDDISLLSSILQRTQHEMSGPTVLAASPNQQGRMHTSTSPPPPPNPTPTTTTEMNDVLGSPITSHRSFDMTHDTSEASSLNGQVVHSDGGDLW